MDRLKQSASTIFPSRIRTVTRAISISFNLALTESATHKKIFFGSYKVILAIRSLPKSSYRSNVPWLIKCSFAFSDIQKKYLDSIGHSVFGLVAATLKMFCPFFATFSAFILSELTLFILLQNTRTCAL